MIEDNLIFILVTVAKIFIVAILMYFGWGSFDSIFGSTSRYQSSSRKTPEINFKSISNSNRTKRIGNTTSIETVETTKGNKNSEEIGNTEKVETTKEIENSGNTEKFQQNQNVERVQSELSSTVKLDQTAEILFNTSSQVRDHILSLQQDEQARKFTESLFENLNMALTQAIQEVEDEISAESKSQNTSKI